MPIESPKDGLKRIIIKIFEKERKECTCWEQFLPRSDRKGRVLIHWQDWKVAELVNLGEVITFRQKYESDYIE